MLKDLFNVLKNLFRKQTQIQYVVKDPMLEKQNKIINKLIRISLDNTDIEKAAQKMICLIKEQYSMKNCSLFIKNDSELNYLATDVPESYKDNVLQYVNTIKTERNAVVFSCEGTLSYPSAEERSIVYSVFLYLENANNILGALYLEFNVRNNTEIFEQEVFKTIMESLTVALENLILRRELIELSKKDQLTKLYNRTYLAEYVETLKDKKGYSVAMLDIDFFKKINDTYGHRAGDDVLRYVSSILNKLSSNGKVFRVGGEEFLIISCESKIVLSTLVEEIRKEIEKKEIISFDKSIKITISVGISDFEDGKSFEDVQNRADQELYRAKNNGRNQISIYNQMLSNGGE